MIFPRNVMLHPHWKSNSGWCEVSVDQRSSACSCDCFGLIGCDRPLHLDPHCASGFMSRQCENATPVLGCFSTSIHSHIPVGGSALQPSRFPRWPEDCSINPASLILSQQCPIYRHCHWGCVFFSFIAVCCIVTEKKAGLRIFANAKEYIRLKLLMYVFLLCNKNGSIIQDYLQMPGCVRICVHTISQRCVYAEKEITLMLKNCVCDLSKSRSEWITKSFVISFRPETLHKYKTGNTQIFIYLVIF